MVECIEGVECELVAGTTVPGLLNYNAPAAGLLSVLLNGYILIPLCAVVGIVLAALIIQMLKIKEGKLMLSIFAVVTILCIISGVITLAIMSKETAIAFVILGPDGLVNIKITPNIAV